MPDQEDLGVLLAKIAVDVADLKKGLSEGRREMQDFKTMAQGVGESVKKALAFAGISIGIYEVLTGLRDFAKEAALTGARTETLEIAMNQVGKTYGLTAESLKYYVQEVKGAGVTTQESMLAITKFLASGLPLDRLKDLATRARDIGVVAGVNTSEALGRMVQGIISGEQEILRRLMIQIPHVDDIYKRYAASLGTTADQLNSVQKAQAILNEVMRVSAGYAGVAAEADASVGKQMASMARFAEEAKNSLWALLGPIMLEIIQQMTKGWKELKAWADANKDSLQAWGKSIAELIDRKIQWLAIIAKLIVQNREFILLILQFVVFYKAAGWIIAFGTALKTAGAAMTAAAVTARGLQAILLGLTKTHWAIIIAVTLTGLYEATKAIDKAVKEKPSVGTAMLMGEAEFVQSDKDRAKQVAADKAADEAAARTASENALKERARAGGRGPVSAMGGINLTPEQQAEKARQEGQAALEKAIRDAPKPIGKEEKGGKGKAGQEEDLFGAYLQTLESKRQAELQAAVDSLDLLKATNEKKRAEYDRDLAAGTMNGQTYYEKLQALAKEETDSEIALIEKKKAAATAAYKDQLSDLARQELSPEMLAYRQQELQNQYRATMGQLNEQAARAKLEGEVKVTNELKRQLDIAKQYKQAREDLDIETNSLLGAVSQQEATLQKLYLDWQRTKQKAIDDGAYTPEYARSLEANYQAKRADTMYGGYASQITQGISSLVDALMQGGQDLKKAANSVFKNLFNEALKPGLDKLKGLLVSGFKSIFGEAGSAIASAVMGVIGLIGMLLTSGGESSWSGSEVQSSVTAHEAVRGIIAGETSIPIAQIGESLQDALVPTNSILNQIEANTRGGHGGLGGGKLDITVTLKGIEEQINAAIERYFREYLVLGARG
ncbi:MAG: hypothetical protein AB1424_01165 [Thermodesulfobacteriota bacterium]